jgi:hypothetical protein
MLVWNPLSKTVCYSRCMLTANRKFAIVSVCFLQLPRMGLVFSLRPQRAGWNERGSALRLRLVVVSLL